MVITIDMVRAVFDIAHFSRNIISVEAADRIAQAFGLSIPALGIKPISYPEEGIDWSTRLTVYKAGESVATFVVAQCIADHLAPGWSEGRESCPYSGAGKSADWATFTALDAIKDAIEFPSMYVREKRGPDKPAPRHEGWTVLGSGEVLGYELVQFDPENGDDRMVLQMFESEDAALETLVFLANEEAK